MGTVASGSNATVTVSYTVPAGTTGDQTNTATVSSSTTDPDIGKHKTTYDVTVSLESRRVLSRSDGETAVTAGDGATHTYTITVSNAGPSNRSEERRVGKECRGWSQGTL